MLGEQMFKLSSCNGGGDYARKNPIYMFNNSHIVVSQPFGGLRRKPG